VDQRASSPLPSRDGKPTLRGFAGKNTALYDNFIHNAGQWPNGLGAEQTAQVTAGILKSTGMGFLVGYVTE
jgi:hypothetical protein